MDINFQNKIQRAIHTEMAKRLLIKYFTSKGFDNFTKSVSPLDVSNLPKELPELAEKIEVIPYVKNLDPITGATEIDWDMFVLAMHRMYLGRTRHDNLGELIAITKDGTGDGEILKFATTPAKIINFVTSMFSKSESGTVSIGKPPSVPQFIRRPTLTAPTASYYERRRWGR